jgi:hypothetical protein
MCLLVVPEDAAARAVDGPRTEQGYQRHLVIPEKTQAGWISGKFQFRSRAAIGIREQKRGKELNKNKKKAIIDNTNLN